MKAVLQRVHSAACHVDGELTGASGKGLLVFFCAEKGDREEDLPRFLEKILKLRIFEDEEGKMNLSLRDIKGSMLFISQFTLAARLWKGNRPSFDRSMAPQEAEALYFKALSWLRGAGIETGEGRFGAHMDITAENDGPVTILLDSKGD